MSAATRRVARMLALVPWLLRRPGATLDEAAAAVGTDRDTVLSDLRQLEFCGLPGRAGGDLFEIQLEGDRVAVRIAPALEEPLRPTPAEALRLVLALDTVASTLGDELPGLADAVAALRRAAGVPAGVVVDPDGPARFVTGLRGAISAGTRVRLDYRGRTDAESQQRTVEPWEVRLEGGRWYLHGHDVDAAGERTFRLDRVRGLEVLDDQPVAGERPPRPSSTPTFVPGPDAIEVLLRVGPAGGWLLRQLAGAVVEEVGDDGTRTVRAVTDAPDWLASLVLGGAGEVVVLRPDTLRAEVRRRASESLDRHRATEKG